MLQTLNQLYRDRLVKGGAGSGNVGHEGVPGHYGGSAPKGGATEASGSPEFKETDARKEAFKKEEFKVLKVVPHLGQSSGVYIAQMKDGSKAIWKEQKGMKPVFLAKEMPRREEAAYEIDRMMGVNLTPTTVMREFNGEPGFLQGFAGTIDPRDSVAKGQTLSKISEDVS